MDAHSIRTLAIAALKGLHLSATLDPGTYTDRRKLAVLDGNLDELIAMLDRSGAVNPAYAPFGEMVGALAILGSTDPDTYAILLGEVAAMWGKDVSLATADGFHVLRNFCSLVGDDHSFVIERSGPHAVVRLDGSTEWFEPLVTPRRLLETVRPLIEPPQAAPRA